MARRSRFIGTGAVAFATGMLIALPTFSSGATVKNDLRSFEAVQPRATTLTPQTEPPLHGTNPHAQGTAAVVNLAPSATRPYSVDTSGNSGDEDIIVGRSRGEQRADGTYHGHITVAAAFGNEIISRDTTPGQTVNEAVAEDLLDSLLHPLGIDLDLVRVRSSTTNNQSLNSFSLAAATLGGTAGVPGLRIGVAESVGNISSDGTCQTSSGGSQVADITAGTAVARIARSSSTSAACRNQLPSQSNTSEVIQLGSTPLNLPPPNSAGCATGAADTETGLPPLLPIVCNADDSSATGGTQATASTPNTQSYGVRNALDVYVLAVAGGAVAQVSAAQAESLAVAPAATVTPPTTTTTTPTTTTIPTTTTTPAAVTTTTTPATTPPAGNPGAGGSGDETGDGGDEGGDEGAGDNGGGGTPECSDGVDNDGDGKIDFGNDPGCSSANDDSEADNAANLGGNALPFTGTDVVVLGLAGSLLLAAGLTLRGPARRREDEV